MLELVRELALDGVVMVASPQLHHWCSLYLKSRDPTNHQVLRTVFPPGLKRGGEGIEHLEAVYALAHTLLAHIYYYPVNMVKRGGAAPPSPL